MVKNKSKCYRFGRWVLNTASRELRCDDGVVRLEPKSFDLLVYLLENRNRAISKEELQDAVWPGVIVAESSLTRCIMKTRHALGDDGDVQAIIKTIPRHGYRFVAKVDSCTESSVDNSASAAPAGLPERPSIAILPFVNLSGDVEHDYLSDGMTEDLITLLSAVPGLFVIARNSSFSYKNEAPDVRQVGIDLGVRYVVEGSVRKAGQRFRVNVQLIDTGDGAHLWADMYDRWLKEIFDVQDEVIEGIAVALGNELYRAEFARARQADEQTLDGWGLVARAMALYHSGFRKEPLVESIRLSREAIKRAPSYARARSLLALNLAMYVGNDWSAEPGEDAREAFESGELAMQLDADDVWVVCQWGAVNAYLGKPVRAVGILRRALELNPTFVPTLAQMSRALIGSGRPDEALQYLETALHLSPRDLNGFALYLYQARAHLQIGNYEEAATAAQRSLSINSSWNFAWFIYSIICMALGRHDEAEEALDTARELQPGITRDQYGRRLLFAAGGNEEHAKYFQDLLHRCWRRVLAKEI